MARPALQSPWQTFLLSLENRSCVRTTSVVESRPFSKRNMCAAAFVPGDWRSPAPVFLIAIHRATAAHLTCCVLLTRRRSVDSLQEVGSCRVGGKACRTSGWQSCVRLAAGHPGTSSLKTQPSARPLPGQCSGLTMHMRLDLAHVGNISTPDLAHSLLCETSAVRVFFFRWAATRPACAFKTSFSRALGVRPNWLSCTQS